MIYLYKDRDNTIALTLDEKATNSSYDVMFVFINESTAEEKRFTANDINTTSRCNRFIITETANQNVYYGRVQLEAGQYKYTVYEMPVSSPKSLSDSDIVGTLETGRVTVYETFTNNTFSDNEDKDSPSFE